MNVIMIAPGYPAEMPMFARGLSEVGVRVLGVGDQPEGALPEIARKSLSAYLRVDSFWDEAALIDQVRHWISGTQVDRVACLWEPGMILAARLREALGVPGMTVDETIPFRDKERMKQVLDAAGIRTPRHARASSDDERREGAERIGFPLIIKPIAGAGSADTHRVNDARDLEMALELTRHVPEVSVEEFIEGEEFTFDTICAGGEILYHNLAWYRPKPLIGRTVEWISPQTVTLRNVDAEYLLPGKMMGRAVLKALGFRSGFTHMEWFLTANGDAVFGEIAARPPGARSVELMNYGCDIDVFTGWAEAECFGRFSQEIARTYNVAITFKRAQGSGRIRKIEGLGRFMARYGQHVVCVDLLPVGANRRNWKATLISDGYLIVRHPDLQTTLEMADRVGTDVQLYAG
ncbi:MAG: ATP-grasp domain-containing protein [Acidobacteriota bacterium]|nr:ATP-grasp domain-containing protein [Acidobacteriota bacterium]